MFRRRSAFAVLVVALALMSSLPAMAATRLIQEPTDSTDADLNIVIRFATGGPGMSIVEYGPDGDYIHQTSQIISLDGRHEHVLTNVEPDTTYSYRIVLNDWTGGAATYEGYSLTTPAFASPAQIETVAHAGAVQLFWEPTFAAASYVIERSASADGPYEALATVDVPRYLDINVTSGETYHYRITARNAAGEAAPASEPESVVVIAQVSEPGSVKGAVIVRRTNTSPTIDGTLEALWDNAIWYPFNTATAFRELGAWESDDDFSAEFALLYDDDNIYFALRAVDNVVVNPHSGIDIWQGDSVEVWFDWGRNHVVEGAQYYQLGLAPLTANGLPSPWVWRNPNTDPVRDTMTIDSSITDTGYIVEAKIPAFTLMTGASTNIDTAFNVSINDIDRPDQPHPERNHITWSGRVHTEASTWASLLFE